MLSRSSRSAIGARACSTVRACSTRAQNAAEIEDKGKRLGIKFYQFSFVDLFGVQRSKLVPAQRVVELATNGVASWLVSAARSQSPINTRPPLVFKALASLASRRTSKWGPTTGTCSPSRTRAR